jgi:hypothetical protein
MPSNTDYMVLWSSAGLGAHGRGYVSGLKQWFTDLAHDSGGNQNTDSVSAQYQDLTGAFARYATTFGGAVHDTQPYPTSQCPVNSPVTECLTDLQIQQELERFVAAHHFKTDLGHEYFLLTPPHVESCFSNDLRDRIRDRLVLHMAQAADEQFNAVLNAPTVEQTTPTITYTFPTAGAYSIGLTIFASDGSSTGTGAIVTTRHSGFTRGFTFTPVHPTDGHTVRFSALTTVSAQPVLTYLWEFGDGSTGSGAQPKHVYAKSGTYTVTLVMFSGVGSAFPGQGAAPIVTGTSP